MDIQENRSNDELVMYIVINKDLQMRPGKVVAQAGHVIVEYMRQSDKQRLNDEWIKGGQVKVALGASQKTMEKLELLPNVYSIRDEGRTEIPADSLTAVCFKPMRRSEQPKVLKRLQLYK